MPWGPNEGAVGLDQLRGPAIGIGMRLRSNVVRVELRLKFAHRGTDAREIGTHEPVAVAVGDPNAHIRLVTPPSPREASLYARR
jgi:hypothetical protein